MIALDEFKAEGDTPVGDVLSSGNPSPNPRLAFLSRRGLSKLERVTAKREMPAYDAAWEVLKGKSKKTNLYNHDRDDVHLWANLLNAILTERASMFILSKKIHAKLMKADKLLVLKKKHDAFKIVIAFALRRKLLEEVHAPSKKGDPKRRARLLRVIDPVLRADLARLAGGEQQLLDDEAEIRVAYDKRLEAEGETNETTVAKSTGDGDVAAVAPETKPVATTKKETGPARLDPGYRGALRDGEMNWKAVASDKDKRPQRLLNMRILVRDLLKRFDADDFDGETFEHMAHCFATEEPGRGADEEKWRKLVSVLVGVARDAFKAETGRAAPTSSAKTPLDDSDDPVLFEGELLGTEETK